MHTYVTTYCNHPHVLSNGKPVDHECYILPPKVLELERQEKFTEACEALVAARPFKIHKGLKSKP